MILGRSALTKSSIDVRTGGMQRRGEIEDFVLKQHLATPVRSVGSGRENLDASVVC